MELRKNIRRGNDHGQYYEIYIELILGMKEDSWILIHL